MPFDLEFHWNARKTTVKKAINTLNDEERHKEGKFTGYLYLIIHQALKIPSRVTTFAVDIATRGSPHVAKCQVRTSVNGP